MDDWYEKEMPNKATLPLFEAAADAKIGFYLGYAELTPEGRRFNTAILVDQNGKIVGKYRKVHCQDILSMTQRDHFSIWKKDILSQEI